MNMLLTLLTLIAIFLIDHTLGKAFDSQSSNKDSFQKDSRGMQRAKEMLLSDQANFYTNPLKSETNDRSNLINSLSQSQMMSLPSCSFLSQIISLQSQLQVSSSLMSQQLQHLLIFGLRTIPCLSTSILSPLLSLQNWLTSQQLWQHKWTQLFWIQLHTQQISFCFTTKTTQKLWLQVSCCLLIRTTQQLRWLLRHRIFALCLNWLSNYDNYPRTESLAVFHSKRSSQFQASSDCCVHLKGFDCPNKCWSYFSFGWRTSSHSSHHLQRFFQFDWFISFWGSDIVFWGNTASSNNFMRWT